MSTYRLKKWESALLIALCVTLCAGTRTGARRAALEETVVRLHVVAESDSEEEQAVKLRVRDAVCDYLSPLLGACPDTHSASDAVSAHLGDIESAARAAAGGREVSVTFGSERHGERRDSETPLPAGVYKTLRVTLGSGRGRNWWGVVFPYLAADGASGVSAETLSGGGVRLVYDSGGRVFRLRLVEWLAELFRR